MEQTFQQQQFGIEIFCPLAKMQQCDQINLSNIDLKSTHQLQHETTNQQHSQIHQQISHQDKLSIQQQISHPDKLSIQQKFELNKGRRQQLQLQDQRKKVQILQRIRNQDLKAKEKVQHQKKEKEILIKQRELAQQQGGLAQATTHSDYLEEFMLGIPFKMKQRNVQTPKFDTQQIKQIYTKTSSKFHHQEKNSQESQINCKEPKQQRSVLKKKPNSHLNEQQSNASKTMFQFPKLKKQEAVEDAEKENLKKRQNLRLITKSYNLAEFGIFSDLKKNEIYLKNMKKLLWKQFPFGVDVTDEETINKIEELINQQNFKQI